MILFLRQQFLIFNLLPSLVNTVYKVRGKSPVQEWTAFCHEHTLVLVGVHWRTHFMFIFRSIKITRVCVFKCNSIAKPPPTSREHCQNNVECADDTVTSDVSQWPWTKAAEWPGTWPRSLVVPSELLPDSGWFWWSQQIPAFHSQFCLSLFA